MLFCAFTFSSPIESIFRALRHFQIQVEKAVVEAMKTRIARIESNVTAASVQLAQQKVIQQRLSHRLLRYEQCHSIRFSLNLEKSFPPFQSVVDANDVPTFYARN